MDIAVNLALDFLKQILLLTPQTPFYFLFALVIVLIILSMIFNLFSPGGIK